MLRGIFLRPHPSRGGYKGGRKDDSTVRRDEARPYREEGSLRPIEHAELAEKIAYVAFYRALARYESARNLFVAHPARNQAKHFELAAREVRGRSGRPVSRHRRW